MPDMHIERHGDRWAVKEAPDATPFFESYTREEAESEARRRADGGRITVTGSEEESEGIGQRSHDSDREPEPHEVRETAVPTESGELVREQQAGL